MSAGEHLVGAGAVLIALCCALLPVAGAALSGGLIAGTGGIGILAGVAVLVAVIVLVGRRRRSRRC
jgi:phage-related minor tail protein